MKVAGAARSKSADVDALRAEAHAHIDDVGRALMKDPELISQVADPAQRKQIADDVCRRLRAQTDAMRNANEVQEFIEKLMQARKTTAQANGVTKEAATPGKSASIPGVKDSFEPAGRGADVPDLKMPGT